MVIGASLLLLGAALGLGAASQGARAAEPERLPIVTPVEEMPDQMAHAYIIGLQQELSAHGYRPGPVDGHLGGATRSAIRAYQRDAGLVVDGIASKELLDHMKFALPKVNARRDVYTGPSRELVTDVQLLLAERGYFRGDVDGRAGPRTREAIRRFQADAKLPVTGIVDQRLKGELISTSADIRAEGKY